MGWWLENLRQSKAITKAIAYTLETTNGNEQGLYIIQKMNAHTFPDQWAFNIRQAD